MAFFDNLFRNLEKVEWSGDGLSKDNPINFLNDILSFTLLSSSESELIFTQLNLFTFNRGETIFEGAGI